MEIDVINNGSVSATNPSTGATGIAAPAAATEVGGVDGGGVLRALNVDSSGNLAALPLPSGAATGAKQDTGNTSLGSIDTKLSSQATAANQAAEATLIGAVTETAPASDVASSGLNGRLQRIAQRLSSLISLFPTTLGQKGAAASFAVTLATDHFGVVGTPSAQVVTVQGSGGMTAVKVDGSAVTQPASLATLPALTAGSAIIGKVGIDQTTPGTTNGVQVVAALPTGSNVIGTVQTKAPLTATGSGSGAAATVSTVATLTAPANCIGFILMNLDTSTTNIRWAVGRTAATNLGQQLQPGRDTGFIPIGANVSVCSESGTNNIDIQWIAQ